MTPAADEIAFADHIERLQLVAASRNLLRALAAHSRPPASHNLPAGHPVRIYPMNHSGMRSPALICAESTR